jgi:stearoyl-CoA desaturase (delta-9 desaturase)
MRKNGRKIGSVDTSDLSKNWVVEFQNEYYPYLAIFMGFIFPTLVAGFGWGDWRGGYFYSAILRLVLVHHSTFSVNSLAHWLGDISYDDRFTPRDHFLTALVSFGEGYHNFHHEFPQDFRNAIKYYQYDPTKWLIIICSWLGLAYDLKRFPDNEISKGVLLMDEKVINEKKKKLNWGKDLKELPSYSKEEITAHIEKTGSKWIVLEGAVLDVEPFLDEHPGGRQMLLNFIGKDATGAFNGDMHDHHNAARNLTAQFRVGTLRTE